MSEKVHLGLPTESSEPQMAGSLLCSEDLASSNVNQPIRNENNNVCGVPQSKIEKMDGQIKKKIKKKRKKVLNEDGSFRREKKMKRKKKKTSFKASSMGLDADELDEQYGAEYELGTTSVNKSGTGIGKGARNSYAFGKGAEHMKTAIEYAQELTRAHEAGMKTITVQKDGIAYEVNAIGKIADIFRVPKTTLYGRYKGDADIEVRPGRRETFPPEVERRMVRHVRWLAGAGFALSWPAVRAYATRLAQHHRLRGFKASHTWLQHLMARHPGCATALKAAQARLRVAADPPTPLPHLLACLSELETRGACPALGALVTPEDAAALYVMHGVLKEEQEAKERRAARRALERERRRHLGLPLGRRNRYRGAADRCRMEEAVNAAIVFEDARAEGKKSCEIEVDGQKHMVYSVSNIVELYGVPSQTLRAWVDKRTKATAGLPGNGVLDNAVLAHLEWLAGKGVGFEWDYVHARAADLAHLAQVGEDFKPARWAKKLRQQHPELLNVMRQANRNIHENKFDEIPNPIIGLDKIVNQMMMDLRELNLVHQTQVLQKFEEMINYFKGIRLDQLKESHVLADNGSGLAVQIQHLNNQEDEINELHQGATGRKRGRPPKVPKPQQHQEHQDHHHQEEQEQHVHQEEHQDLHQQNLLSLAPGDDSAVSSEDPLGRLPAGLHPHYPAPPLSVPLAAAAAEGMPPPRRGGGDAYPHHGAQLGAPAAGGGGGGGGHPSHPELLPAVPPTPHQRTAAGGGPLAGVFSPPPPPPLLPHAFPSRPPGTAASGTGGGGGPSSAPQHVVRMEEGSVAKALGARLPAAPTAAGHGVGASASASAAGMEEGGGARTRGEAAGVDRGVPGMAREEGRHRGIHLRDDVDRQNAPEPVPSTGLEDEVSSFHSGAGGGVEAGDSLFGTSETSRIV